jgi:hypothetical protein
MHRISPLFKMLASAALVTMGLNAQASIVEMVRSERMPDGFYGPCGDPRSDPGNSFSSKARIVSESGKNAATAQFIDVLACGTYDGSGGSNVVDCPKAGYSYCVANHNDGLGNSVLLGVVADTAPPGCQLTAKRTTPEAQIDVQVNDRATGVAAVEFRGGLSNVQHQAYTANEKMVLLTFTKINPALPAVVGPMLVYDRAGNYTACSQFEF